MEQYHTLLKTLLTKGSRQFNGRTGYLMLGSSGEQSIFDLKDGFPATTTKSLWFKGVSEELLWFARGERRLETLVSQGIHIWDRNAYDLYLRRHKLTGQIKKNTPEWEAGCEEFVRKIEQDSEFAKAEGDLGPIYGYQWRHWPTRDGKEIDQLKDSVIGNLRKDPGTRYAILTAWNPEDLGNMALAPCHCFSQFDIWENKFLDLNMFQRSCDVFLGVPFNIASYALLNTLVAKELGVEPRRFIHSYGNVHVYAGVSPRGDFLKDDDRLKEFRAKVAGVTKREDYLDVLEWYNKTAPPEGEIHEGKDHIPYILKQLSYEPQALPTLEVLSDLPFFEAIERPASEVVKLRGYKPAKWESKAVMAA